MNSIFTKGMCLLAAGLAFILLIACSSDDETDTIPGSENFTRDMIVGEWFQPAGDGAYTIGCYNEDGSLNSCMIYATNKEWVYTKNKGNWDFSDGLLTVVSTISHSGILNTTAKAVYRPIKLTKYELQESSLDVDLVSESYRIVDTYQMNVGETRKVIIDDNDFVPQEYSTVSYHVASVESDGIVEARHLGTTYILIKSSIGTAVIRIVVNDSANDFNDALQSMGLPIQAITKEYGQKYTEITLEDGKNARLYHLADEKVMELVMYMDTDGYVESVEQRFSNSITPNEVRASLNRKYDFLYSKVDGDRRVDWYETTWQCRKVTVSYSEKMHQINMFFLETDNNLQIYDSFFSEVMNMNASLWVVAYVMEYTLTYQDYLYNSFVMSAPYPFKFVEVAADENGYVNRVNLYFDNNITFKDVKNYITHFYLPTTEPDVFFSPNYAYYLAYSENEDGYLEFFQYDKRKSN